jgi:transcriptional regulator with XRE-family HTH domain
MNKIKSLRIAAGMSQEELAERTGLSLRTIQRIENGETRPRGDSLRRLSQALGVTMEVLRGEETGANGREEHRGFLVLLHLSALAFLLPVPGLGIAAPLVLWLLYRDKIERVGAMGRGILKFQITWLLVKGLIYLSLIVLEFNHLRIPFGLTPVHLWLIMRILDAFNINYIVTGAIRANKLGASSLQQG